MKWFLKQLARSNNKSGFTLIEIIVVIAIVGILAAIISSPFGKFRNAQALQNTTNAIVSVINSARTKTLASVNNTSYGVHIDSDRVILFTGISYNSEDATNQIVIFEPQVTLETLSLNGGGAEILFDRLKGTTSQYGTIVIDLPSGQSKTITVQATGSVLRN